MKRALLKGVTLLSLTALAAACSGTQAYRYKQYYAMIQPITNYDRYYEDTQVSFQFDITEKKIYVQIVNRSADPVTIDWPNVYFVDTQGVRRFVANEQTLFTRDLRRIRPTTIRPGDTERNVIVPAENMEELEQWTWYVKPFYTQTDDSALLNLKKTFRVVIPAEAGAERRRYSFQFMVTDVVPYTGLTPG